jgi:mono/diheme cytochrome c family protein
MRRIWKVAAGVAFVPMLGVAGIAAAGQARWDRTFDAPEPQLLASLDAEVMERGRYLAYGPAHCAYCHTKAEAWPLIDAGEEPPLSGGYSFSLPFGTFYSANLTPDEATGIGRYTDGQLARVLRHGVRLDGRAALPFMEFQNLSDEDIVALISFLRSRQPVRNEVPAHELNAVGKSIFALLIRPAGPAATPPATAPAEEATVERGAYLANNVANCAGCHTQRSQMDGSYTAARFSGGMQMVSDEDPTLMFVTPNLTPDSATGHIYGWSEEQFLARFRAGRIIAGSHMPWAPFAKMSDTDLRAIYRYLQSLAPVTNETGPLVQPLRK